MTNLPGTMECPGCLGGREPKPPCQQCEGTGQVAEPDVRCLTIRPPWSWAVQRGGKLVENRGPSMAKLKYRGELFVHAGGQWSKRGADDHRVRAAWHGDDPARVPAWGAAPIIKPEHFAWESRRVLMPMEDRHLERRQWITPAAIVAVVNLADVHLGGACMEPGGPCHPWGEDQYQHADGRLITPVAHLVFDDLRPLDSPVRVDRGWLGLWYPARADDGLIEAVYWQLGVEARERARAAT